LLIYYTKIYEAEDKVIYSFWYIRWSMYWKSILLTALHTDYDGYDELAKQLRRFYYLYWIAGKTLSQIKQSSFNLIKWIKEKKPVSEISEELNNKLEDDKIESLAKKNLLGHIAFEPWCKPLLLLMEYNATDNDKPNFIELNKDLHLEHIFPIKYAKYEEWGHITDNFASAWLHSAGNLTLLSGAKNIEASNNPFPIKMEVYKGKGKYDDKNNKITSFVITQQIVNDFESNCYKQMWTDETVLERWKWFFREAEELLEIDFSVESNVFKLVQDLS